MLSRVSEVRGLLFAAVGHLAQTPRARFDPAHFDPFCAASCFWLPTPNKNNKIVNIIQEEFVLEHNRHHASTVDLLIQGEFGWDPEDCKLHKLRTTILRTGQGQLCFVF